MASLLSPAAGLVLFALVAQPAPANLSGPWRLALDPGFNEEPVTFRCELTHQGQTFTLECDDQAPIAGAIDDRRVTFTIMTGKDNLLEARFSGRLNSADTMIDGTWRLEDTTGNRIGRFSADRQ